MLLRYYMACLLSAVAIYPCTLGHQQTHIYPRICLRATPQLPRARNPSCHAHLPAAPSVSLLVFCHQRGSRLQSSYSPNTTQPHHHQPHPRNFHQVREGEKGALANTSLKALADASSTPAGTTNRMASSVAICPATSRPSKTHALPCVPAKRANYRRQADVAGLGGMDARSNQIFVARIYRIVRLNGFISWSAMH